MSDDMYTFADRLTLMELKDAWWVKVRSGDGSDFCDWKEDCDCRLLPIPLSRLAIGAIRGLRVKFVRRFVGEISLKPRLFSCASDV